MANTGATSVEVRADFARARKWTKRTRREEPQQPPVTPAAKIGQTLSSFVETTPPSGLSPPAQPSRADATLQHKLMRVQVGKWNPALAVEALLETITGSLEAANDIHLSTVLHRLATFVASDRRLQPQLHRDPRFLALLGRARAVIPTACPRAVTTLTWALGKLELPTGSASSQGLLDVVAAYIENHLSLLDAQGVANTLYAFALLQFKPERLLLKLTRHLPTILAAMKPQEISNAVYALARLGLGPSSSQAQLAPLLLQQQQQVGEAKPNTSSALLAVTEFVVSRVGQFKTQELSNLVYSHAMLGLYHEEFCRAAEREMVERNFVGWLGQDLSNTVFGFSKLEFPCERLFKAVRNHGLAFLGRLNLNALSMTLSGFAALNLVDAVMAQVACDHVIACLSARVFTKSSLVTLADLLNFLHALVRFRRENFPIRADLAREIGDFLGVCAVTGGVEGQPALSLAQVAQVATLLVKLEAPNVHDLLSRCRDFLERRLRANPVGPSRHHTTATLLALLDVYVRNGGGFGFGCGNFDETVKLLARELVASEVRMTTKHMLEAAFNVTLWTLASGPSDAAQETTALVYKAAKAKFRAGATALGPEDLCKAIVCFLRGAMVEDLEKACAGLADCLQLQSSQEQPAVLDTDLAVATFRFLGKYRSEPVTAGRVRGAEALLRLLSGERRVAEMATSDVMTMCEAAGRVRDYVSAEVLEQFLDTLVHVGMARCVGEMNLDEVLKIFDLIKLSNTEKSPKTTAIGKHALDLMLALWLPRATLGQPQYAKIMDAINPFTSVRS